MRNVCFTSTTSLMFKASNKQFVGKLLREQYQVPSQWKGSIHTMNSLLLRFVLVVLVCNSTTGHSSIVSRLVLQMHWGKRWKRSKNEAWKKVMEARRCLSVFKAEFCASLSFLSYYTHNLVVLWDARLTYRHFAWIAHVAVIFKLY